MHSVPEKFSYHKLRHKINVPFILPIRPPTSDPYKCIQGQKKWPIRTGEHTSFRHAPLHPLPEGEGAMRGSVSRVGSRALADCGDADGPSAANNRLWSRKCTARLLRRSDASASVHGCAGTHSGVTGRVERPLRVCGFVLFSLLLSPFGLESVTVFDHAPLCASAG